jgi:hypothetical protein
MISEFSDRTQRLIAANEAGCPGDAGLGAAVIDAHKALSSVAPEYSFAFHLDANPKAMGKDPFRGLLADADGWLGFVVHSLAYRLAHFIDDLASGLNNARPYRSVSAARSLVEFTAFVHHNTKTLTDAHKGTLAATTEDFKATALAIVELLKVASNFARVTRFNWRAMTRGDTDEFYKEWGKVDESVKAPQILNLIDKLPGEEKRAARFFYEMLCDFVHPNAGSHILLVTSADQNPDGTVRWTISQEANTDEPLLVLLHVIAIPVRDSIRKLLHDLAQLQHVFNDFHERRRDCESVGEGRS